MAKEWFYAEGDQKRGPFSSAQLKDLAVKGQITPSTLVRTTEMSEWEEARRVKGLFPTVVPSVPPSLPSGSTGPWQPPPVTVPPAPPNETAKQVIEGTQPGAPPIGPSPVSTLAPPPILQAVSQSPGQSFQKRAASRLGELWKSIIVSVKLIGRYASRTSLQQVALPRAYRVLGERVYAGRLFSTDLRSAYERLDGLTGTIESLHQGLSATPPSQSIADKLRAAWNSAQVWFRGLLLKAQIRRQFVVLGRSAFDLHKENAGPQELVQPIQACLTRLAAIDSEVQTLLAHQPGQLITPRRTLVAGACLAGLLLIGLAAITTSKHEGKAPSEPQLASSTNEGTSKGPPDFKQKEEEKGQQGVKSTETTKPSEPADEQIVRGMSIWPGKDDPSVVFDRLDFSNIDYSVGPQGQKVYEVDERHMSGKLKRVYRGNDNRLYEHGRQTFSPGSGYSFERNFVYGRAHGRQMDYASDLNTDPDPYPSFEYIYSNGELRHVTEYAGDKGQKFLEYDVFGKKKHGWQYRYLFGRLVAKERYETGKVVETQRMDAESLVPRVRGSAYLRKEDYDCDKAIADLTEAIRLDPKNADAYRDRGLVYNNNNKGDTDKAIADLTEAIRLDPKNADAYCYRGSVYGSLAAFDKAIADLTEAIRLDPKNAEAYCYRGSVYNNKGEYDTAIADLTESIRLDRKYAEAYRYRGFVYSNKGQHDKAETDFDEAKKLGLNPP